MPDDNVIDFNGLYSITVPEEWKIEEGDRFRAHPDDYSNKNPDLFLEIGVYWCLC